MYFVYVYYVGDVVAYIGKALEYPYMRYRNHILNEHTYLADSFLSVDKIGLLEFNSEAEMEIAEHYLIVQRKPIWNARDVAVEVSPEIVVEFAAKEKYYSIYEFQEVFGPKDKTCWANRLTSKSYKIEKEEIEYFKRQQTYYKPVSSYCPAKLTLFYVGEELVLVEGGEGHLNDKRFWNYFYNLKKCGADFFKIDRVEQINFHTQAEAYACAKYIIAKEKPAWNKYHYAWRCRVDGIKITNIPSVITVDLKTVPLKAYQENVERAESRAGKR